MFFLQFFKINLFLLFLFCSTPTSVVSDCSILTNEDLSEPQPLIVDLHHIIKYPQHADVVSFYPRENFTLSCPGSHLLITVGNLKLNLTEHETATCISAKLFSIQNTTTIFSNITCAAYPVEIARLTNNTCEKGNQEIEIGFLVHNTFIKQLRICFDNKTHGTLYSHFELTHLIRGRQLSFPRSSWSNDDFYHFGGNSSNKNANGLLFNSNQVSTINKLIGYNNASNNPYINISADLYLSRGHLAAKADFVFGSQQRLTFHMVNSAPQWQTFNSQNWASLEADTRNLATDRNLTLQIYTGTYKVMSLPHMTLNKKTDIYLYVDDRGNQEFPVPLLFWKYLYEPIMKAGIVLVGVNHPYIRNISEAVICKDIYNSINWTTTFMRNDIVKGIMYACSPDDFRKTVTYLPQLPIRYLLTFNNTHNYTHFNSTYSSSLRITANYFAYLVFIVVNILM